ncbi:MAG: hypothetical protein RQ724_00540 [Desulfuromonadales bacterium]|nr:hypothetical protein [Desulfuromonadales bacterium]
MADFRTSAAFTALEKDILEFTEQLTDTPVRVPEELYQRLAAELSKEQLVELAAAIALENFSARFNHAFAIEVDEK